ncbi:hypothetical protein Mycch_0074 [Mycolicibacterium chubuense NBB4]|uniref:ESX-1 secretion-associated protein EspJ n=1 Tax=Mycolicibacterium chubuense (strain NBB4) TaxID=710421 RepID=I4BC95_MYCCN|nr:hypothetical protein [Mycolicibacterium chubuense]AFM14902.1 hypothetical protein Mycch_0074 [Mycolicibacterium chubuense NBB4]
MGNPPPLSVDPEQLEAAGGELLSSAAGLPSAPAPFMPVGTDPLSTAIIGQIPVVEGPVMTELPAVQAQSTATARNVVGAAQAYAATDQQLGGDIGKEMQNLPNAAGLGSGGAAGSAGGSAAGSMSQMMSMPMQMAGQMTQMPMQVMGAAAAVPQGIMQGAQQLGQQVQQMVGQFGQSGQGGSTGAGVGALTEAGPPSDERVPDGKHEGAEAGEPGAERAPEARDGAESGAEEPTPGRHRAPEPPDDRINL